MPEEKEKCKKCGNDTFYYYPNTRCDGKFVCTKCGEVVFYYDWCD